MTNSSRVTVPALSWPATVPALIVALLLSAGAAEAKTPGHTYCFNGICHRVKTIAETERQVGANVVLQASYYDSCAKDRLNPCGLTSSGERFQSNRPDNAASPIYPDGTKLLVWHPKTKKAAVIRINNAGPYYSKRTLDLSKATADRLGFGRSGVASVQAKVIAAPTASEATYRRNRKYAPVPGFMGIFDTIDQAFRDVGRAFNYMLASPSHAVANLEAARLARKKPTVVASAVTKPPARHARIAAAPAKAANHRRLSAKTAQPQQGQQKRAG